MKMNAFILATLVMISSCGSKKALQRLPVAQTAYSTYELGDPIALVKGTTTNPVFPLTSRNVSTWKSYYLVETTFFYDKQNIKIDQPVNIKEGQVPTGEDKTGTKKIYSDELYKLTETTTGTYEYKNNKSGTPSIGFEDVDGNLVIKSFSFQGVNYPAKLLHYSQLSMLEEYSLLLDISTSSSKRVVSLHFSDPSSFALSVPMTDKKYKYLFGNGVKVRWTPTKPIVLNICLEPGELKENIYKASMKAVDAWQKALNGNANFKGSLITTYPPFSDLNTHCVYLIKSYLRHGDKRKVGLGTTFTTPTERMAQILDSDIMIFEEEYKKVSKFDTYFNKTGEMTMLHEIGHFLGLHHEFDENVPSIMSYDSAINGIRKHDTEAIQALYK